MQVDFGEEGQTEHNLLTANGHTHTHTHTHTHAHYDHQGPGSGPAYSPFRHPNGSGGGGGGGSSGSSGSGGRVPAIDSGLDQSTGANRNVHTPMSAVPHQAQSGHLLQPDSAGHLAHGFYGDMRNSQTPPASANASPRFSAISPTSQPRHGTAHFEPTDREPPPRDVSDDTIDHAYATFILYCNPNFSTTTDTTELVKLFRTPPKSDGNAFSTWALFELIRKFDAKEIKTWTQLALDLGVKPPNTDEGQSTQKVQQYSVRLKRWMRAMHIDAFFEYLLGKQHPYFLQIPPPHQPFPSQGRDGVPLEEDLAIRALDPKFKPKRGRRKADEGDDEIDFEEGTPARKRPQLDTSVAFGNVLQPQSAYPTSAHPNNMHGGFLTPQDPWTAVSTVTPSSANTAASAPSRLGQSGLTPYTDSPMSSHHGRWRVNPQDTPHTPHPLSAVTPQSAYPFFDEPQSAVTPSSTRSRSRRRHGPAVSSAWSTNSGTSNGKLRGRPPSNRSIRDGPFVTFPANPKTKEGPPIDRNPGNLTPIVERAHSDPPAPENSVRFPPTPASAVSQSKIEGPPMGGAPQKQRLSLQVPPNVGNPVVRLTTPTVLVNGLQNDSPSTGIGPSPISAASSHVSPANVYEPQSMYEKQNRPTHQTHHGNLTPSETPAQQQPPPPTRLQTGPELLSTPSNLPTAVPLETLNRALAAELIRAPMTGRRKRLRGNEAKRLASAILQPLHAKPSPGSTPPAKVMSDYALSIAISSCLGLAGTVGVGIGGPTGGVRRVECIRFRVGGDGYESPVDEEDDDEESENAARGGDNIKETFDVFFTVAFGGLTGEWVAKGLDMTSTADGDEPTSTERDASRSDASNNNENWKSKFLDAQSKLWEAREEVSKLKDKILEAVL